MPQNASPRPEIVPAQPAQLRVGENSVAVPSQPMTRTARKEREVEFVAEGPDCLVLEPTPASIRSRRWMSWAFVALMAGLIGVIWTYSLPDLLQGAWWAALIAAMSLPFLFLLVLALRSLLLEAGPARFRFDRRSGQLSVLRTRGLNPEPRLDWSRPLVQIGLVQLLRGGFHSYTFTSEHSSGSDQYFSYEMNLLFNDGARTNLAAHADWRWLRAEGRRLAEFLGKPLIDELGENG